jgi:hypothetical protein
VQETLRLELDEDGEWKNCSRQYEEKELVERRRDDDDDADDRGSKLLRTDGAKESLCWRVVKQKEANTTSANSFALGSASEI